MITDLRIEDIRIDADTQSRVAIDEATVAEYAQVLEDGGTLPPVTVFHDGVSHILADGFHRLLASKRLGMVTIEASVQGGTSTDAKLYAYGANITHGLRRTTADKRKAVEGTLALRPEWSDRVVAKHCGVSHTMVAAVRSPERAEAQAEARAKSAPGRKAEKVESDSTPSHGSSLPPAEPPSIVEQRKPGDATITQGEDDDLEDDPATLMAEMSEQIKTLESTVRALQAEDGKAQLLKAIQRAEHAERRTAELMTESARSQQRAERYERMLARIGKAVGERDLDKIAPVVEAMARAAKKVAA